jgi:hypothetical protein
MAPPVPLLGFSLLGEIAIAWVAVSLVVALTFGVMAARLQDRPHSKGRTQPADRRAGMSDRRIGLPDTRPDPVERRRGPADRRGERRLGRRRPSIA